MKTAFYFASALAMMALACVFGELAYTVHRLRPRLEVTITNIDRATIAAGAAAGNVEKASRAWQRASEEQAKQSTSAMIGVSAAARQLSLFVTRTDESLNTVLLPQLSAELKTQSDILLKSQGDLQDSLLQMSQATQRMQATLADADKIIASPALQQSIDNLAVSTQNTAEATRHLAGIADAGEQTARYYQKKLTTPASFAQTMFNFVLDAGSKARILFNH